MRKGTTGTHYKPTGRRDQSFTLRLTADELTMIREKAQLSGLSVGDFIVQTCSGKRVPGYQKPKTAPVDDIKGQLSLDDLKTDACDADVIPGREIAAIRGGGDA